MEDPSQKLITDSMMQGRMKGDGTLESWAHSRTTNLLDSHEEPSRHSRSDAIFNSKSAIQQYIHGDSQAETRFMNIQNFDRSDLQNQK